MSSSGTLSGGDWGVGDLVGGVLLLSGVGLAGVGAYFHLTIAAQVRAGRCDGCEPWHPLVVVAPFVVGLVLALLAGAFLFLYRR